MSDLQTARLRYRDVDYGPNYYVVSDNRLFRRLKSKHKSGPLKGQSKWKQVHPQPHHDGYELWYPKNPLTEKYHPGIVASRAVAESFAGEGWTSRIGGSPRTWNKAERWGVGNMHVQDTRRQSQ